MINSIYEDAQGTMFIMILAGESDDSMYPVVKERALFLKYWFEKYKREIENPLYMEDND